MSSNIYFDAFYYVKNKLISVTSRPDYDSVIGLVKDHSHIGGDNIGIKSSDLGILREFPHFFWTRCNSKSIIQFSSDSVYIEFVEFLENRKALVFTVHNNWPNQDFFNEYLADLFTSPEVLDHENLTICVILYLINKWINESIVSNPSATKEERELSASLLEGNSWRLFHRMGSASSVNDLKEFSYYDGIE